MIAFYHKKITCEALSSFFSERALHNIVKANLRQDSIIGQLFHNEYHFDNNKISEGITYIQQQKIMVLDFLTSGSIKKSWHALGRLVHSAQDFYAHSNYISLWIDSLDKKIPQIEDLSTLDPKIIKNPNFHSHIAYFPLDFIGLLPGMAKRVKVHLPLDSHANMNLDSPESGENFHWAYHAALKRTIQEFSNLKDTIVNKNIDLLQMFLDKKND